MLMLRPPDAEHYLDLATPPPIIDNMSLSLFPWQRARCAAGHAHRLPPSTPSTPTLSPIKVHFSSANAISSIFVSFRSFFFQTFLHVFINSSHVIVSLCLYVNIVFMLFLCCFTDICGVLCCCYCFLLRLIFLLIFDNIYLYFVAIVVCYFNCFILFCFNFMLPLTFSLLVLCIFICCFKWFCCIFCF